MSFIEELQRRKVVRTLVAYLAAAFVTAQAAQLLVEGLDLPATLLKIILLLLIAGLPLVVGLSWAFDVKRESAFMWKPLVIAGVASVLILAGIMAMPSLRRRNRADPDFNLVAVMPFRVSSADELRYLREGMVDLLATKLTGEGGPRAADPRATISAWQRAAKDGKRDLTREESIDVARNVGAGQVLLGSIVGTSKEMTISAALTDVRTKKTIQADIRGSADTLTALIDHLTAELLTLRAGEESQRLANLTSTSLPALRAYLDGQRAYRAGQFGAAMRAFSHALAQDSTFALAAMGHILATGWGELPSEGDGPSERILLRHRDRLGLADRAIARAIVGDSMPDHRSVRARLDSWEAAVTAAPDRADAWFIYGDQYMHYGALADVTEWLQIAERAFNRSLALDSTNAPALLHLIDLAILDHDADRLKVLDAIRARMDSANTGGRYQFGFRARALGDSAALRALRASLDTGQLSELFYLSLSPVIFGNGVDDALLALDKWVERAATVDERLLAYATAHDLYQAMGMPSRAARMLQMQSGISNDSLTSAAAAVFDALYADGDEHFALQSAAYLERLSASPNPEIAAPAACITAQWRLLRGQRTDLGRTVQLLGSVPRTSGQYISAQLCGLVLQALAAHTARSPRLRERVETLDRFMRAGPDVDETLGNVANFVLGRMYSDLGEDGSALRAVKRHALVPGGFYLISSMWREEARLRAATGDRKGAVEMYQKYLNIRTRAEPAVRRQDDAVRRELAELTGENGRAGVEADR